MLQEISASCSCLIWSGMLIVYDRLIVMTWSQHIVALFSHSFFAMKFTHPFSEKPCGITVREVIFSWLRMGTNDRINWTLASLCKMHGKVQYPLSFDKAPHQAIKEWCQTNTSRCRLDVLPAALSELWWELLASFDTQRRTQSSRYEQKISKNISSLETSTNHYLTFKDHKNWNKPQKSWAKKVPSIEWIWFSSSPRFNAQEAVVRMSPKPW